MTASSVPEAASGPAEFEAPANAPVDPEHGLPPGFGAGAWGRALFFIAVAFSAFQLFTSTYAILPAQVVRAVHVGFLLLIGFGLVTNHHARSRLSFVAGWVLALAGFGIALYQWIFYQDLIERVGDLNNLDLILGVANVVLIFVLTLRVMGVALPIVAGTFILYVFIGRYLPEPFTLRPYGFDQIVDQLAFGTEGIYGTPIGVSATFIFLFILFGAFLERAGMIQLFTDVSMGMVGHARGGPAKVAVMSSCLMGTISGSGVANVVTTGQFTIPLMKRFGYRAAFAGGVEATASMGGQIMPPVMGAVAFIMAETLGVPYSEIVKAAIIPALLYYFSAFWMVHLEAGKHKLLGLSRDELPDALGALKRQWFLIAPLAVLVYLLFFGFTPLFAGAVGLALTALLILGGSIALGLPHIVLRTIFWVGLGVVAAAAFAVKFQIAGREFGGADILIVLVALLILANALSRGGRETLSLCRDALAEGARQAVPVGIACAIVGTVIGVMTLTGIATTFGNYVVSVGQNSLLLSLILTMIVSLVLGMGIPTIPNYIITSSLAAPALLKLGVPLIVSHMFVFYFGIMADLTPPVALAAFAAAPIARESGFKIGYEACRIALPGFVVPYMAIYNPALMLQDGGPLSESIGYVPAVIYMIVKATLAVTLWGAAAVGFLHRPLTLWERLWAFAAAAFFVAAIPFTDEVGFAMSLAFFAYQWWSVRTQRAQAA